MASERDALPDVIERKFIENAEDLHNSHCCEHMPGCEMQADILEQLRAAFRLGLEQGRWQPIATAPKDGRWLLFSFGSGTVPEVGNWFAYSSSADGFWQAHTIQIRPTHWMPLPAPPAGDGETR